MTRRSIAPCFWLVVAIVLSESTLAQSAPFLIGFDAVISASAGAPPGGSVSAGTPFTGTLAYDSSAPDSLPAQSGRGLYLFSAPPSGLQVSVDDSSYGTDPSDVQFAIEMLPARCIDKLTGTAVPCNPSDPNQLLREPLDAVSKSNLPIDGVIYTISLFQLLDTGGHPRDVSRFGQLPRSAEILAAQLSGATLTIEGSGFSISATVNSAAAVSEPARAFFRPSGSPQ